MAQDNASDESQLLGADSFGEGGPDDLGDLLAGDLGENDLELGSDGSEESQVGFNTDLSGMSREQIAEVIQTDEGLAAFRNQAKPQSQHTREWQRIAQENQRIEQEKQQIALERQQIFQMLQSQAQAGNQGPMTAQQEVDLQTRLQGVTSWDQAAQILTEEADKRTSKVLTEKLGPIEKALQQIQVAQFSNQVEREFNDLAERFPALKSEVARDKVRRYMAEHNVASPTAAFGALMIPALAERQRKVLEAKAQGRKDKPTTKPGHTTGRTTKPPATPAEAKAALKAAVRRGEIDLVPPDVRERQARGELEDAMPSATRRKLGANLAQEIAEREGR